MNITNKDLKKIGARTFLAFLDSVSPVNNLTSSSQRILNWGEADMWFDGMADPYKVFSFDMPNVNGGRTNYRMSTAELMKIDRAGYEAARGELSNMLSEMQEAGILSIENPWNRDNTVADYMSLANPKSFLTDYPFKNDVYTANITEKVEGMAVPTTLMSPAYLTPRVFDRAALPDDMFIRYIERIYTAVHMMHVAANCNPSLSPAVHIALNRLGSTEAVFAAMDNTARSPLVPKTQNIPEAEVLRGAWADNRYFGDMGSERSICYSNKNAYLPMLGNPRDTRVPNLYRTGDLHDGRNTRFVNPAFPEYLTPIHCVKLPAAGMSPSAGFTIVGMSDVRYKLALSQRRPLWTFADQCTISIPSGVVRPGAPYEGSGNLYSQFASWIYDGDLASWRNEGSRIDETNGPYGVMRRLRDWYYANKPNDVITVSDPITDMAAAVQLARFMVDIPPHVLLHSVMGFHNAMLKLSFLQVNVPYSTSIEQYALKMRLERDGLAAMANKYGLIDHGTTEPGYALTVKAPSSVIMADAGLQAATVTSLSIAAATCAANPAVGVVCIALVGIGILVAELEGGRAQNLVTPRNRAKEDLRYNRNGGVRTNWLRGITPEWVVNSIPVQRV
jgi:hypothetical protein